MSVATDLVGGFGRFLAAAWPDLVTLWESHGKDNAAALRAFREALAVARAKTDADLDRKHNR